MSDDTKVVDDNADKIGIDEITISEDPQQNAILYCFIAQKIVKEEGEDNFLKTIETLHHHPKVKKCFNLLISTPTAEKPEEEPPKKIP